MAPPSAPAPSIVPAGPKKWPSPWRRASWRPAIPAQLTLVHASGIGDWKDQGTQHFAHPGMVRRWIGGHTGLAADFAKMVIDGGCEGYCLPQGVIAQLWREIAAHRPGVITKIGLGTFVDPRLEGGKMNKATTEDLVQVVQLAGRGVAALPHLPGGRGHHPRHHRRRGRQPDGGGGRRAAGVPAPGAGGQEQRRHRHRPGRVPGQARHPASQERCACRACWWTTSWWPSRRTTGSRQAPTSTRPSPAT